MGITTLLESSRGSREKSTEVVAHLIDKLLLLLGEIAIDSDALNTAAFRRKLETFRSGILRAPDAETLSTLGQQCVRGCQKYFAESKAYLLERETELKEVITLLQEALKTISGENKSFHGKLMTTTDRLSKLTELDDIRTLKSRIIAEVDALKRMAEEKQRQEENYSSELAKKVEMLTEQLNRTKEQAEKDSLTGVANRRAFDDVINDWIKKHRKSRRSFTLAMVDLDDFKRVNDEHGHSVGDRVLKRAAVALRSGIRDTDFVARYGGEEFVVLFADTELEHAESRLADVVRQIAESKFCYESNGEKRWIAFTLSGGITEFGRADSAKQLIRRADEALYQAKKSGKNCVKSSPKSTSRFSLSMRRGASKSEDKNSSCQ